MSCPAAPAAERRATDQPHFRHGGPGMSDLIVIGYPDEKTADNVWQELVKLE